MCEVRALVVLPTKELAQQVRNLKTICTNTYYLMLTGSDGETLPSCAHAQVYKVFGSYAEGTPLKVVMLAGQKSFAAEQTSLTEQR